jgi:hypothetical protein
MYTRFSWNEGTRLPDQAAIVSVRDDRMMRRWAYLPEDATRPEIEKDFAGAYDLKGRPKPVTCTATIREGGEVTDRWAFTIHPPAKTGSEERTGTSRR